MTPNNQGKPQVAASLTLSVSPLRWALPAPLSKPVMVWPDDLGAGWERQGTVATARASLVGGAGQAQTQGEKIVGQTPPKELRNKQNRTPALTKADPAPQNV